MQTYEIPRNYKGEGRILYIFSTKGLIYTCVGAGVGLIFYFILKMLGFSMIGLIITLIFAAIGFVIGTSDSVIEPIYLESEMTIDGDLAIDTTGRYILLAREVLETPVVLAPGESRTFEIAIKF